MALAGVFFVVGVAFSSAGESMQCPWGCRLDFFEVMIVTCDLNCFQVLDLA